jgi:hypothetical protein
MTSNLKSHLPAPTKQRFAATFHVVRQISVWVQLVPVSLENKGKLSNVIKI